MPFISYHLWKLFKVKELNELANFHTKTAHTRQGQALLLKAKNVGLYTAI